jgi:hypothetical protein
MSNRAADASVLGIRSFTLVVRCIVRYRRLFFWDGCCSRRRTMRVLGRVTLVRVAESDKSPDGNAAESISLSQTMVHLDNGIRLAGGSAEGDGERQPARSTPIAGGLAIGMTSFDPWGEIWSR